MRALRFDGQTPIVTGACGMGALRGWTVGALLAPASVGTVGCASAAPTRGPGSADMKACWGPDDMVR